MNTDAQLLQPSRLSRRAALRKLSAASLLSLGLWPGTLRAKVNTGEPGSFRFIAVNDTHYMSPECGAWLEAAVRQMKNEGVEFCLLSGDLTEKGEAAHLAAVRDIFAELGQSTYVQIGNHDYVSQTDRTAYEKLFPNRLNYVFEHRGWQFVGIDSSDGQRYEKTDIQTATIQWLDDHLRRLDPRKPTVIFTHFPLGEAVQYRPGNSDAVLERFRDFNLKGIFGGHYHSFTLRFRGDVFAVTNRCCALKRGNHDKSPTKGYFVCTVADGQLTFRFVEVRAAKWA